MLSQFGQLALITAPALCGAGPMGRDLLLFPVGHLHRQAAITVDDEAGTIEHQFVLPADPVEVGQRKPVIDRAALGHAIDPQRVLVDFIGAAVDADQQLGSEVGQMPADIGVPDILADRQSDHHAFEYDRFGQRAGLEQADLIKRAVVGQLVLQPDRGDLAAVEQSHAVVQIAIDHKDRANKHRRAGRGGGLSQIFQFGGGAFDQRGFEYQILGRIADQLHFGENDQIGPGGLGPCAGGQHCGGITSDIADRLVQLGEGYGKRIDHDPSLSGEGHFSKQISARPPGRGRAGHDRAA